MEANKKLMEMTKKLNEFQKKLISPTNGKEISLNSIEKDSIKELSLKN